MSRVFIITGTRKGIGRALCEHYLMQGAVVCGCSRGESSLKHANYRHFKLDVSDESAVVAMIRAVKKEFGRIDVLLNNAGIASMNHTLTTPLKSVQGIFSTNVFGSFLFMREVAKVMASDYKKICKDLSENLAKNSHPASENSKQNPQNTNKNSQNSVNFLDSSPALQAQNDKVGVNLNKNSHKMPFRIVNFATVATPLRLEGEAIYAASKAALVSLTQICAKELSEFGITINAVGPTPVPTDLIKSVPKAKMDALLNQQAIKRFGDFYDVLNVIEFFISAKSDFITAQVVYLGGVCE